MITVQIATHCAPAPAHTLKLKRLVRTVCRRFGITQAAVSIGIVDDAEIAALNRRFLEHEGTTDCLSFDLSDETGPGAARVFDLVVNGALAIREAARRGHSAEAELALYVTHGLLHQLGFDDTTAAGAQEMHRIEDEILQHSGYGSVYNRPVQAR